MFKNYKIFKTEMLHLKSKKLKKIQFIYEKRNMKKWREMVKGLPVFLFHLKIHKCLNNNFKFIIFLTLKIFTVFF